MKIAVYGTGGVGGYFGGRLAQSGEDVTFIARGKHLAAMQATGLRVDSIKGDFIIQPIQATDQPAEVGIMDVVLVAVKAWQVPDVAVAMQPMIGEHTIVVPLENGVEAPDQLSDVLGPQHVLGGFCRIFSSIAGPGHIQHMGSEPFVAFGELDNTRSERVESLYNAFKKANVAVEIPADIHAAIWQKFLFICAMSGVGAITRAPIGIVRTTPETRHLFIETMREIVAVAQAKGVNIDDAAIEPMLNFVDGLPVEATASMQRDIMEGRPSELESQTGAVVRLGQAAQVSTPLNTFIYHSLLLMERRARGEVVFEGMD